MAALNALVAAEQRDDGATSGATTSSIVVAAIERQLLVTEAHCHAIKTTRETAEENAALLEAAFRASSEHTVALHREV